ncbi:MAG: 2-oxoacid:acceptor oxidoreductase family protein [Phycisphaerae bacterium]|nr:2-oxoacid:acceptor oxidoreductase family protein [Phycisphaerae bacterium]
MIEITIHGRGGQGGVTLAKLIATAHFLKGLHAQAFGVYAAERSGAPLQAYVRIDDDEITIHNQVQNPDHVIVLDRTLIGPQILIGHKPQGWIVLNTPQPAVIFAELFPGRNVAVVDATSIAVENNLGTRTVPIVNTALLGAVCRVLELTWEDVDAAIRHLRFDDVNVRAARQTYERIERTRLPGEARCATAAVIPGRPIGLLDPQVGAAPKLRTGNWATRRPERQGLVAPCAHACPAGNDISAFIAAVVRSDPDEALRTLLRTSPLPGVCGRVCPAPCIDACNRNEFDEPVHVRELERYAADHGELPEGTSPWRSQPIAVIGSGPAGLSCAYHLARLGYPVTVYEAGVQLGGLLRTGIPIYRLPREVLDREIGHILDHGVTAVTGITVTRDRLDEISRQFAAVFVAVGLQKFRSLDLGTAVSSSVIEGIEFLDRARRGRISCKDQRVVVVGGGNTAIDAARTALRLSARSIRVLYRRTRKEMPAIREEIEEALAERIEISELVLPTSLRPDHSGHVLTCSRMRLGEPDESGRRRPLIDTSEGSTFEIGCDVVILALGQAADLSILPAGATIEENRTLGGHNGSPIILGGDFATQDGTVAHAIGSGRRAAMRIHRSLTGEDLLPELGRPIATSGMVRSHMFSHSPAELAVELPPDDRRRTFDEVRLGYVDDLGRSPALAEASRCFSCGTCTDCGRCIEYCPEGILVQGRDGCYNFNYDYCKGCGVCASQCPRGVIHMTDL